MDSSAEACPSSSTLAQAVFNAANNAMVFVPKSGNEIGIADGEGRKGEPPPPSSPRPPSDLQPDWWPEPFARTPTAVHNYVETTHLSERHSPTA